MVRRFEEKKPLFKELVQKFKQDPQLLSIERYGTYELDKNSDIDKERLMEYRKLLYKLDANSIKRSPYSSDIHFEIPVKSFGTFDEGETKGYIYSEVAVPNIRNSLDNISRSQTGTYHKTIDKDWYIFLYVSR